MEALVCRRTLTGHKDDVLHITGLRLSDPAAEPRSAIGEREASPPPDPGLGALFATSRCRRRLQSPLNCRFHVLLHIHVSSLPSALYVAQCAQEGLWGLSSQGLAAFRSAHCVCLLWQCRRLHPAVALALLDLHPHLRLFGSGPRRAAVPLPVDSHDGEVRLLWS